MTTGGESQVNWKPSGREPSSPFGEPPTSVHEMSEPCTSQEAAKIRKFNFTII
ncbi:hypothetical protein DPMN_098321 [Dreissena polymorpha]|uniref:Uncharacterized protein n=1 Tax=Dreissena polymorpha TaxID=45954 RepID=A0A9D4R6K4_DREPO|nr:hypothetical protein DPMN_098321 [Dreissena polymorpha]